MVYLHTFHNQVKCRHTCRCCEWTSGHTQEALEVGCPEVAGDSQSIPTHSTPGCTPLP